MLKDRYGLALSTSSPASRDAYVEGCDLVLMLCPGAAAAFDRAIVADPGFALAHAGRARALQMYMTVHLRFVPKAAVGHVSLLDL
jgi:hypothetical protein